MFVQVFLSSLCLKRDETGDQWMIRKGWAENYSLLDMHTMMLMSVCTRVCACVFCSELILVLRSRPASAYKVLELEACATKPFAEGCHEAYFMGSLIICHPFSGG